MFETHLVNFFVVITIQLVFFLFHFKLVEKQYHLPTILMRGLLLGLPFGIVFDLLVGKYIGIFEYALGFELWFLLINGLLSYGLMMANVFLLHDHTLWHSLLWSFVLGCVYEVTNAVFPVWEWTFGSNLFEYLIVLFFAYFGLTVLMMLCLKIVFKTHFLLIQRKQLAVK